MPELAEVEFFRRRWWEAAASRTVRAAEANPRSRVYRRAAEAATLAKLLPGAKLIASAAAGKQMMFTFKLAPQGRAAGKSGAHRLWLGLHLGMSGELRVERPDYSPQKHDALILRFKQSALVFSDPRQFGRVRATPTGLRERPHWVEQLPPGVLALSFTPQRVEGVLRRHARAPLKAVLLNQKYFFGLGNWMADEILWRAALHPALPAGRAADPRTARQLHRTIQRLARDALRVIAGQGSKLPPDLNVNIPDTWLFNHRWKDGGICPKTKKPLRRAEIGGRTSCWSPARQRLSRS